MNRKAWVSLILVWLVVFIFDGVSHMWGPGNDYTPIGFLWETVENTRLWTQWVGLFLVAYLLYLERKGNPIGKYWILYPIFRLLSDVGWMAYFQNPYPSWYAQDFGAFIVSMPVALILDHWGLGGVARGTEQVDKGEKVKLWISIISLLTALIGLIKALFS